MSQELIRLSVNGEAKLAKNKWKQADGTFTIVIDRMPEVKSNEEAALKCSCLQGRALARLIMGNTMGCKEDGEQIIQIYKQMRPNASLDGSGDSSDPLIRVLSLGFLRVGQANEMLGDLFGAMSNYVQSAKIFPSGDGTGAKQRLWGELGMTEIDRKDEDLAVFVALEDALVCPEKLGAVLTTVMEYLASLTMTAQILKINSSGSIRLFYGLLLLYYKQPEHAETVRKALDCLAACAAHGAQDVWIGYQLLQLIASVFYENFEVICSLLHVLQFTPSNMWSYLSEVDFIGPLSKTIKFDYNEHDRQTVFWLLFQLSGTADSLGTIYESGCIEVCMKAKTTGAFLLISKLCGIPAARDQAISLGITDWVLEVLGNKDSEPEMFRGAFLTITRILWQCSEKDKKPEDVALAEKTFDLVTPILMANTKTPEIVGSGFAALALCVPFVPNKVTEKKMITAASVMLSMYKSEVAVATNIVTFLWDCANNGMLEDIKNNRAIVTVALEARKEHTETQALVERAVGLAVLCDHPEKERLISEAARKFPESNFMTQFIDTIKFK